MARKAREGFSIPKPGGGYLYTDTGEFQRVIRALPDKWAAALDALDRGDLRRAQEIVQEMIITWEMARRK